MKMTNLVLMAAALVLAPTARSDSYTFTPGTEIPLGADVESTRTIAGYVATTGTATLDDRDKDGSTYYVLGTRYVDTTITLSLVNETAGDYVLYFKTGMSSGNATGTVNVSDGAGYSKALEGFSLAETGWDLKNEHLLLLPGLPAGAFSVSVNCVSTSNGSGYCGNYGHFVLKRVADVAFVLPSDEYLTVDAAYASLAKCSRDNSNNGHTIGSTGGETKFSFTFYCPRRAKYGLTYKTGSNGYTANLNWTVSNAISGAQVWPVSGAAVEPVANNGTWDLTDAHTLDFGELDAGLYVVGAYVSDRTGSGSYAGNYGDFLFTLIETGDYELTVSYLVTWDDYHAAAQNVIVEEGGAILIDATDKASGGTVTLPTNVTLPQGADASDYFVIKTGAATTEAFNSDGTVSIAAVSSVDSTTWACPRIGDWATAGNWTHGVPSGDVAANFKSDASATLSAAATVKKLDLNGHAVTLSGSEIVVDSFDLAETGVLKLKNVVVKSNGVKGSRKDLDIPAGISIVILADGNNSSTFYDNYGDVNVHAPLVFEDGARLVLNYKTPLLGGASGNGTISAASGNDERIFAGDWRAFTGEVFGFNANKKAVFADGFAATSSTWSIYSAEVRGDVSLGVVNFATDADCVLSVASGVDVVTLAGGSIGANVTIPAELAFYKTGVGTLTLDGCTLAALTVSTGAIAAGAAAPTVGTLAMAAGSYVVANTTATINATTAAIDGVKVLVADAMELAAGTAYSLVSATTLSGTSELYAVDSDGNHVAASNGKAKDWWLAKARGGVLRLTEGNPNAGMSVVIR